jgi:hypothetical protein
VRACNDLDPMSHALSFPFSLAHRPRLERASARPPRSKAGAKGRVGPNYLECGDLGQEVSERGGKTFANSSKPVRRRRRRPERETKPIPAGQAQVIRYSPADPLRLGGPQTKRSHGHQVRRRARPFRVGHRPGAKGGQGWGQSERRSREASVDEKHGPRPRNALRAVNEREPTR